ncbi:hypothetical protein PLICRDRAFT_196461 [Plicaturopsis crispa FD-325 SS-3]|nr:hypothetical protein PLICRDRAFT_196461 [Plicaturopsis crispa FD-325 SS-3]
MLSGWNELSQYENNCNGSSLLQTATSFFPLYWNQIGTAGKIVVTLILYWYLAVEHAKTG